MAQSPHLCPKSGGPARNGVILWDAGKMQSCIRNGLRSLNGSGDRGLALRSWDKCLWI
jgi:hypothetical protein